MVRQTCSRLNLVTKRNPAIQQETGYKSLNRIKQTKQIQAYNCHHRLNTTTRVDTVYWLKPLARE